MKNFSDHWLFILYIIVVAASATLYYKDLGIYSVEKIEDTDFLD